MKHLNLFLLFCLCIFNSATGQEQFTVYFDFDMDEATTTSGKGLSSWIAANKGAQIIKIYGYADAIGNKYYNVDISERRAAYVVSQLKANGFGVENIESIGYGAEQASGGKNAKDRKVIVYFTKPEAIVEEETKQPETAFTKTVTTAEIGDKIRIPNLNFYNNSDIILPESRPILNELLTIMRDKPLLKIDIQGHICCQKNEENQISLRRAVAIYAFLIRNDIDKSRLSYKSFGSSKPIYPLPEKTEAEKVANRRVEIEIISH